MSDTGLCPQLTFDEFVTGTSNIDAYNAALSVASCGGIESKPLTIFGWNGLGKTHLLHAIGNAIKFRQSWRNVQYFSLKQIMPVAREVGVRSIDLTSRVSCWMNADTLLIDDLDLLQCSDFPQLFFFKILEYAIGEKKQLVFGTKVPIEGLADSSDVLRKCWISGISGTNVSIHNPDIETKRAVLKMLAEQEGIDCPAKVILALANRDVGNFKDLVNGLYLLWFESKLRAIPISLDLFYEVMESSFVGEI